ncbi:STAS domain protein [compost metagenome]
MRLLEAVQSQHQPKAVLFDAEAVTNIDVSGIAALREVRDTLAAQGIFFAIARARGTFLRMLVRSGMAREMEDKLLFGSVRAGIRAYRVWRNRSRSVPAIGPVQVTQGCWQDTNPRSRCMTC